MYETGIDKVVKDSRNKMQAAVDSVKHQFATMRTGRAHPSIVEGVKVDYYGTKTPIKQLANISTPDARTIAIQPWDKNTVSEIEKAIQASDVGITPTNDGKVIRLNMPQLTHERRDELKKVLHRVAEEGKVSIRNTRHEALDKATKMEKNNEMTEDDKFLAKDKIQKVTDEHITQIDKVLEDKEKEIMG
jgi:ribosome recycling factor